MPAEATLAGPYVPFPRALKLLNARQGASAEELAAWVFLGETLGGLRAFLDANDLDPPPRFSYAALGQDHDAHDFMGPLMGTWYALPELERFRPQDRFITGRALLERWTSQPGLSTRAFILAKVRESRLRELHPVVGLTQASCSDASLPDVDETLFYVSDVEAIEQEDLGVEPGAGAEAGQPAMDAIGQSGDQAGTPEAAQAAPPWAPDWPKLGADQRARRLQQRKRELQREGVKDWRKRMAADLAISGRRVTQYLERLRDADPFTAMRADLPRTSADTTGKRER